MSASVNVRSRDLLGAVWQFCVAHPGAVGGLWAFDFVAHLLLGMVSGPSVDALTVMADPTLHNVLDLLRGEVIDNVGDALCGTLGTAAAAQLLTLINQRRALTLTPVMQLMERAWRPLVAAWLYRAAFFAAPAAIALGFASSTSMSMLMLLSLLVLGVVYTVASAVAVPALALLPAAVVSLPEHHALPAAWHLARHNWASILTIQLTAGVLFAFLPFSLGAPPTFILTACLYRSLAAPTSAPGAQPSAESASQVGGVGSSPDA